MELKCKKCGGHLELEDTIDTDGSLDEGYFMEKRWYSCADCNQDYSVGINVKIPVFTEKDIIWFEES